MNRSFIVAVLTVTMIIMMSTAGHALVAPHQFACDNCHGKFVGTGAVAATNSCLTCHNSTAEASRMPIDVDAMSNHFGSATGQPAKGSRSTHTWGAATPYNAAAMVQEAQTAALNTSVNYSVDLRNKVLCIRCHDAKNDNNDSTSAKSKPFLRVTNANDALCTDCHRSRLTPTNTAVTGSHPIAIRAYSTAYKLNTTAFRKVPLSPNAMNPTAKLGNYFKSGKIVCTTCHAPHYADSSSATLGNRSTANGFAKYTSGLLGQLQESKGQLLRTDPFGATANAINVCSSCHKETKNLNHNGNGQNIQCNHCHGAHVDYTGDATAKNLYLVRRDFSNMSTTKIKLPANTKVIYNTATSLKFVRADNKGICQICHTVPHIVEPNARKASCTTCHTHANGFSGVSCTSCHGQPPISNTVGGPYGKSSVNYTLDESLTPHATHASTGYYNYACKNCHYDGVRQDRHNTANKSFADVFVDTAGSVGAGAGFPNNFSHYSSVSRTCNNVYCHSNGNPRGGSIAWKSSTPSWNNGRNQIVGQAFECTSCHESGNTLVTNAHYKHVTTNSIKCTVCHNATVSSAGAIINRNNHVNGAKDVSFITLPDNYKSVFSASFDSRPGFATCVNSCHTNGVGVSPATPAKWTDLSTGACGTCHAATPVTTLHPLHFTGTYGPKLGSSPDCASCHDYTAGASTHANGVTNLKAGNSCAPCHPAAAVTPIWATTAKVTCESCHTGTASIVLSQSVTHTAPLIGVNGHSQYSSAILTHVRCTTCHNPSANHIDNTSSDKRLSSVGNDCTSCHSAAAAKGLPAPRIDLMVHGGAINSFIHYTTTDNGRANSCSGCHDTHGTTNLSSIRTVINGQSIVFTDGSTGFFVSSPNGNGVYNGLCQVCHTKTKYFRKNTPPTLSHANKDCLTCHLHKPTVTSPITFAFQGLGGCNGCHGYPPVRDMSGLGIMNNYSNAKFQDYSGGGGAHTVAGHLPRTVTQSGTYSNCTNCHYNVELNNNHNQGGTPVQKAKVNVMVNPKFKFRNDTSITYNASSCSNVSCHFKPSPNWTNGQ